MLTTSHVELDQVHLNYGACGPSSGTPVLFLHGYPDMWFTWEEQMRSIAERGYRAVAPDQRGYGRSSKSPRVRDYRLHVLGADAARLLERLGATPAHVVGHDFGGVVACQLASTRPELVRSLTLVNAPHPDVMLEVWLRSPAQLLRSWYVLAFQIPGLADTLSELYDSALLLWLLGRGAPRDAETLRRYREQLRNPSAARAPLNWYRAAVRHDLFGRPPLPALRVPSQVLWGTRDPALTRQVRVASARRLGASEVHGFAAGHWPFLEQPAAFHQHLVSFFARHDAQDAGRLNFPKHSREEPCGSELTST